MSYFDIFIRLTLAIIIGGLIGYEREYNNMPAGFRTNILVCIGATIISLLQGISIDEITKLVIERPELQQVLKADVGRLGAQVISGIGFLGAGTIIHEKGSVKGLTTAATLWAVACIGLAVGSGYYALSITSTIFVVLTLVSLKKIEKKFLDKSGIIKVVIETNEGINYSQYILEYFNENNIDVKNIDSIDFDKNGGLKLIFTIFVPRNRNRKEIKEDLSNIENINKVSFISNYQ